MTETSVSPAPVEEKTVAKVDAPKKAAAKARKPSAKPTHPSTADMVKAAIKTLGERGGSSLQAIKKYIAATYKVDVEKQAPFIKKFLKGAVTKGTLVQTKGKGASGSFKLAVEKAASKPKATSVKKAAPKKPAAAKKPAAKKTPGEAKSSAKKAAAPKKAAVKKPAAAKKPVAKAPAKPKSAAPKAKKAVKGPTAKPKSPKPKKVAAPKAPKAAARKAPAVRK
ncbi:histone H1-like [Microplitis mediator]|uniref:histone H1-like n=1 Tax=Microplitis mediator TaxID=375433 RepID=UPI0025571C51|nr:histone H1-like [Microplitis mediator]